MATPKDRVPPARRRILQGLLEENLRLHQRPAPPPPTPGPGRRRRHPLLTGLVLLAGLLGAAGLDRGVPGLLAAGAGPAAGGGAAAPAVPAGPAAVPLMDRLDRWREYGRLARSGGVGMRSLFGLGVQTIVIDPGHGGRDPGAIGPAGTYEKDITLDLALRLGRRLAELGPYEVVLTRSRDEAVSLRERVERANRAGADLFVSVHVNALSGRPVDLVETYFFGPGEDQGALELAEQENRGSRYGVADFRRMIRGLQDTLKWQESRRLAGSVHARLYAGLRAQNPALLDWGVKTAPFVVLLGVEAPSILSEVACITNPEEEQRLRSEAYRERLSEFLAQGISDYLQDKSAYTQGVEHDERGEQERG